jgi:predicted GNAT superfamily acetyltransferase
MIRDCRPGDFDEVRRMNNENDPAVSWLERDELESDLAVAKYALVIGDDIVKGFCVTFESGLARDLGVNYKWFTERYPNFVYLDRVVIDAPHRSQRLGEALYREVERRIREEITTTLLTCEVNLRPRNDGSLRFHARLGFEQVGEQESRPGLVVAMLAKRLA